MTRSRRRPSHPSRFVPLLFFLGGCLLLTLALIVLGAFWFLRGNPTDVSVWQPPLESVDPRALVPGTIILPLTEMSSADALSASLDQAHLENAYALLAYDPDLPDAARIGALLQLGTRYTTAKDTRKASVCYQAAALLATLSPALSDVTRLDTYHQASAGLRAIGANQAARWVTDQSYLVTQHSPNLSRDVRMRRLNQIADAYAAMSANSLAAQARTKANDLAGTSNEVPTIVARPVFNPTLGKLPASSQVDAAKQHRFAAAQQLADDLKDAKPGAVWPSDSLAQLADALLAEDEARQAYYDQQLTTQDPAIQIALWNDQVHWLALKNRIARGAFSQDLVPEWSKNKSAIADAWHQAWEHYFRLAEAQAGATKSQDPNLATEFVLRQELMVIRWGWSVASEEDVRNLLDGVNQSLKSPFLMLDAITRHGKLDYVLVPAQLYGQGEQALPK